MNTASKLYFFSIATGFQTILRGQYKIGLKRFLYPIPYWRLPVFNIICDAMESNKFKTVLDIGSPKLLSLFLAIEKHLDVYATDLQDNAIFSTWETYYNYFLLKKRSVGKYIPSYEDARNLTYPNESFDIVYSISVLEHIPDTGDTLASIEISRVLKEGGIAIIEVPFALNEYNTFVRKDIYNRKYNKDPLFYERCYDENSLFRRIIEPSGLELKKIMIIAEKYNFEKIWKCIPKVFKIPFLWSEGIISLLNHKTIDKSLIIMDAQQGNIRSMAAIVIMEKSN